MLICVDFWWFLCIFVHYFCWSYLFIFVHFCSYSCLFMFVHDYCFTFVHFNLLFFVLFSFYTLFSPPSQWLRFRTTPSPSGAAAPKPSALTARPSWTSPTFLFTVRQSHSSMRFPSRAPTIAVRFYWLNVTFYCLIDTFYGLLLSKSHFLWPFYCLKMTLYCVVRHFLFCKRHFLWPFYASCVNCWLIISDFWWVAAIGAGPLRVCDKDSAEPAAVRRCVRAHHQGARGVNQSCEIVIFCCIFVLNWLFYGIFPPFWSLFCAFCYILVTFLWHFCAFSLHFTCYYLFCVSFLSFFITHRYAPQASIRNVRQCRPQERKARLAKKDWRTSSAQWRTQAEPRGPAAARTKLNITFFMAFFADKWAAELGQ